MVNSLCTKHKRYKYIIIFGGYVNVNIIIYRNPVGKIAEKAVCMSVFLRGSRN